MTEHRISKSYYNYITGETDDLSMTPEDWTAYIPQAHAAQALYRLLIEHRGLTPIEAAKHVLQACLPEL